MDEEERLPSGVVGGVFSITADPPEAQRMGRCMASACLRPLFRLVRAPGLAPPVKPRVRGEFEEAGALAKGISTVDRDVDATG